MKILSIRQTKDDNSRMKAVAEILLENGIIIHEVRVIESEGILTINLIPQNDYSEEMMSEEEMEILEDIVIKEYRNLIRK